MGIALEAKSRWSDAELDAMRQTQDPPADGVVAELFAAGQVDSVNRLMTTLVDNDGLVPDALPPLVRDYLARSEQLPEWTDPKKIETGERLFWRCGPAIVAILHCYSLPFCYAGRKGVQVLALTSRLYSNPTRRIIETAQMIVDVMRPGGLGSLGSGIRTAQKVRLMHAGVRLLIAKHAEWDPAFDRPINQEDMAGTLLAFSYITLDGLRQFGYVLTDEEADAYLHSWNVVGHILGIRPEMTAATYADAEALATHIAARQFAPCPEGQFMTAALVQMMQHIIPGNLFDGLPPLLMRHLLGDRTADVLGVANGKLSQFLTAPVRLLERARSDLFHQSNELAALHELFARALIQGILLVERGGKRIPFTIPTELLQAWGINWTAG